ncbi:MAG: dihydrolipoyl dehydrogenase [Rhodocyclales bacterium]|nr:dihydrolipoyl dehydrogenase [Rhodocyclales bacterium]
MSSIIEVKVPDIGDFKDVPVIGIEVSPGDTVKAEDPLVTLESDKATMEVPSPAAGVVKEIRLKIGDKVAEGTLVLLLETGADESVGRPSGRQPAAEVPQGFPSVIGLKPDLQPTAPAPQAARHAGAADIETDMLVLGAGPGGYSAAFRSADLGMKTVLVERYASLGGVCLNVGCIPSKALLHVAAVMEEAAHMADCGVSFAQPALDLDKLRAHKAKVVSKLTGGLAGMAKARKVDIVRGYGHFLDANHLEVELIVDSGQENEVSAEANAREASVKPRSGGRSHKIGEKKVIRFQKCIIAAGSSAVRLPFIPDDPRIVDSTGALELRFVPKRMLVIGGGIIGLEMATVYSTLGAKVDVVEMLDGLMQGPDRDLVKVWEKKNAGRFDKVMLKTKTVKVEALKEGLKVWFEGERAPAEPQLYDMILQSAGRSPNGKKIGADQAGVAVDARGFITVDKQMRTNIPHIYAIGDLVGQPMLAHKAVHEAHVAAEAAAGHKSFFDASVIPGVAYTDPEVAWVGLTEDEAKKKGVKVGIGKFPWAASGRAIANGADYGFTKLIFDEETHRIVGGAIVGPNAGDMIGEIALAIEMGADAVDIGKTIHPHPTLGESISMAAEVYEGVCTDLPPAKKK